MNGEPLEKNHGAPPVIEHHPAYLAVIAGLPVKVFKLATGSFIIGRGADADFQLDHFEISRRHRRVPWDGETCTAEALQSQRGTRLDHRASPEPTPLNSGDTPTLGSAVL